MKKMKNKGLFKKYREVISYLFFGAVTTVTSILSFAFFEYIGFDGLIANIFSWILSVFIAFITNTIWVFDDTLKNGFVYKMFKFYTARVSTLVVEEILLFIFIKLLLFNSLAVKSVAQVVLIVLNYIISKWFVFKKH